MTQATADSQPITELAEVDSRIPGLYASAPQPLPFEPSISVRAFLVRRDDGNVLVYSVDDLGSASAAFDALGGISRQYLNHGHEAMFSENPVDAPLFVHEADAPAVVETRDVRATFSRRHTLDDDFEVIPTPGHTPGATAYLWDAGEHRLLFTGDSIYLEGGRWKPGLLASSDRDALIASLELIRELDFDVLVPWAAAVGQPYHSTTDRTDARSRIDAMLARLRRRSSR